MSYSYRWSDPKSKDGLTYIRRDGETNPDSKRGTDAPVIVEMAGAVETLAIAYYCELTARRRTWAVPARRKLAAIRSSRPADNSQGYVLTPTRGALKFNRMMISV